MGFNELRVYDCSFLLYLVHDEGNHSFFLLLGLFFQSNAGLHKILLHLLFTGTFLKVSMHKIFFKKRKSFTSLLRNKKVPWRSGACREPQPRDPGSNPSGSQIFALVSSIVWSNLNILKCFIGQGLKGRASYIQFI